ncbi:hypothetical protein PV646_28635 [Streptomyces sp. ID05-26A]|nr:hypothetical protein [Streptomyces sp. ID05-26A]
MDKALVGSSIVGIVALVWGGVRLWKKKPLKLTTWLWVIAGFTLAGSLVTEFRKLVTAAAGAASGPVGVAAHVIVGLVGLVLMWLVWHEAPLRKGKGRGGSLGDGASSGRGGAKTYTPVMGLLGPVLLLSAGGVLGDWARGVGSMLGKLAGPLGTFFGA